jgi:hypothetical protein
MHYKIYFYNVYIFSVDDDVYSLLCLLNLI